jgi:hypothetical protein
MGYACCYTYTLLYIRLLQEALEFSPLHRVLSRALHEHPGVYASAAAATATATTESDQCSYGSDVMPVLGQALAAACAQHEILSTHTTATARVSEAVGDFVRGLVPAVELWAV